MAWLATEGYAITPVATPGLAVSGWPLGMAVKAENRDWRALESAMGDLLKTGTVQFIFRKHGITHIAP